MVVDAAQSNFAFLPTSGMGTVGTNLLTFVRPNWSAGYVDAVAVRMDHTNASSDTTIALFDVVIIDNVSARTVCNFELTGVRAITQAGIYQQLTTYADSVDVNSIPTGVSSPAALASIRLYPNPANTRRSFGPHRIVPGDRRQQPQHFPRDHSGGILLRHPSDTIRRDHTPPLHSTIVF
jgi:hypothetical protein